MLSRQRTPQSTPLQNRLQSAFVQLALVFGFPTTRQQTGSCLERSHSWFSLLTARIATTCLVSLTIIHFPTFMPIGSSCITSEALMQTPPRCYVPHRLSPQHKLTHNMSQYIPYSIIQFPQFPFSINTNTISLLGKEFHHLYGNKRLSLASSISGSLSANHPAALNSDSSELDSSLTTGKIR